MRRLLVAFALVGWLPVVVLGCNSSSAQCPKQSGGTGACDCNLSGNTWTCNGAAFPSCPAGAVESGMALTPTPCHYDGGQCVFCFSSSGAVGGATFCSCRNADAGAEASASSSEPQWDCSGLGGETCLVP